MLETGEHFHTWEYEKTAKKKGGKVYIEVTQRGEVKWWKVTQGFSPSSWQAASTRR